MHRVTLHMFMAVLLAIAPTLVAAGSQAPCNMQACCCRQAGMPHQNHTGMDEPSCTCSMDLQNTCHIQSNPFLGGLAIALAAGSGTYPHLSTMSGCCNTGPSESLHSTGPPINTELQPIFNLPPGYLLHCALII